MLKQPNHFVAQSPIASAAVLPPLQSGDRLSRPEFERRYTLSPSVKKAELVEGVVFVESPLRFVPHAEPHSRLATWLGTYAAFTVGTQAGIEPTVQLDLDNELQPDGVLILDPALGGRSRLTQAGYLEGAPELVVEIAASSAAIDMGSKKQVYRRNGVLEYLVWQVYENQIDWFSLQDGEYVLLQPDEGGMVKSLVFPGLWLAVDALRSGQMVLVLEGLQAGLRSTEHQAFVQSLIRGEVDLLVEEKEILP